MKLAQKSDCVNIAQLQRVSGRCELEWSSSKTLKQITKGSGLVVLKKQALIAYLFWQFLRPGLYEILQLATHPAFRNKGVMKWLMSSFERRLRVEEVWIEVASDNHAAFKFYKKQGFFQVGIRPGYYREGVDAILLTKRGDAV